MYKYGLKTNFFNNITTIEELKQHYRTLVKHYHPDINKSVNERVIKDINNDYEVLSKELKNAYGKQATEADTQECIRYQEVITKLMAIITDNMQVTIELCGTWLYVYGLGTRAIKEELKKLDFNWSSSKKQWYLKPENTKFRRSKGWDHSKIQATYGSEKYKTKSNERACIN